MERDKFSDSNIDNIQPEIDLSNIRNSQKRKDLETIIKVDPQLLSVEQKKAAKKSGVLRKEHLAPFQGAKAELKNTNISLAELLQKPEYEHLTTLEQASLKVAVRKKLNYQKSALKKNGDVDAARKLQDDYNQRLQQQLSVQPSTEEKTVFLCQYNTENHDAFVNYLLSLQGVQPALLSMVAEAINNEMMKEKKLRIFWAICKLYRGYPLLIDVQLYQPMLEYLISQPNVDSTHAIAFSRLAFQNDVSFASFREAAIENFDLKFAAYFDQLYHSLADQYNENQSIFEILPKTCLILSGSMIKGLKTPSSAIFRQIPFVFAQVIVNILTFTFSDDYDTLEKIVHIFVNACNTNIERIKQTKLCNLLDALLVEIQKYDRKWFKNLESTYSLLEGALQLISDNKVQGNIFSAELCQNLLQSDEFLGQCLSKPAQLLHQGLNAEDLSDFYSKVKFDARCSRRLKTSLNTFDCNSTIAPHFIQVFEAIGISLTEVQQLCIKLTQHHSHLFLNPGAGTGKSTLLVGMALSIAQKTNEQVLCINCNTVLLQRDFSRAREAAQRMTGTMVSVELYENGKEIEALISFMTPAQFKALKFIQPFHVLYDEYQTLYSEDSFALFPLLNQSKSFVGTSGSPSEQEHAKFLCSAMKKGFYVQFPDQFKYNIHIKDTILCKTLTQQIDAVAKIAARERGSAPVLLIMNDEQAQAFMKKSQKPGYGQATPLFGQGINQAAVNNILYSQFKEKRDGLFGIFITDKEGGTGIDYPSNLTISNNGGVRVVVCIEPTSYGEFQQFKKRTGRMESQGTVFVVLNKPLTTTGQAYLATMQGTLRDNEIHFIRSLQRKINAQLKDDGYQSTDDIDQEEVKADGNALPQANRQMNDKQQLTSIEQQAKSQSEEKGVVSGVGNENIRETKKEAKHNVVEMKKVVVDNDMVVAIPRTHVKAFDQEEKQAEIDAVVQEVKVQAQNKKTHPKKADFFKMAEPNKAPKAESMLIKRTKLSEGSKSTHSQKNYGKRSKKGVQKEKAQQIKGGKRTKIIQKK